MTQFIFKNIGQRIVLLFFVSIISHAIVHLAPGEPSLVVQYVYWMKDLFTAELRSFKDNQPVLKKIWDRFLNSLPLFIVGTLIIWFLAFPVGIQAALHRGSIFDKLGTFLSYALISIPVFFLSYICIIFMVKTFNVPVIGMRTFGLENASLMLQDYIRTARAKGLSEDTVIYRHGLRNALLPFITMFGLTIPGLIGGSVIFETIFAWPGMGRLGFEAILARDFPVILTLNFISAILVLIGTFVSDILYAVVDPRIKF